MSGRPFFSQDGTRHRFSPAEIRLGAQRGGDARRDHCRRVRKEREREILRILRRAGGSKTVVAAYGEYVETSAYLGWPIVGYPRFSQYVSALEDRGVLRRSVTHRRDGTESILEVRSTDREAL